MRSRPRCQRVWDALIDVERVAPCLPGASVTSRNEDGSYNGEFKVKIGPTSAAYSGKLNMESVDEDSHQATMQAAGTDKRGQGGAKATIDSSVEEIDAGTTQVNVSTDYHITGRLARFGRGGMIEEISNRLLREFATNLQAMLADDGELAAAATTGQPAATPQPAAVPVPGQPTADASSAEVDAAADEPPVPQAGSSGRARRSGACHRSDRRDRRVRAGRQERPEDDRFAPPVAPPPPSGVAAGNAPPPPSTPTSPPPETEPIQGLSLVGGALVSQIKNNPAPFIGALVAILVVLGILRRRPRG